MSDYSRSESASEPLVVVESEYLEKEVKPLEETSELPLQPTRNDHDQTLKKRPLESVSSEIQVDGNVQEPDKGDDDDESKLKKKRSDSPQETKDKKEEEEVPTKSVFGFSGSSSIGFSAFGNNKSSSGFGSASTSILSFGFGGKIASGSNQLVFGQPVKTPSTPGFESSTGQGFGSFSSFGTSKNFGQLSHSKSSPTGFAKQTDADTIVEDEEPVFTPIVTLPQTMDTIINGEENEETILSIRAKLFKLSKVEQTITSSASETPIEPTTCGIQMATKIGADKNQKETNQNKKEYTHDGPAIVMDWKEVGIGPLRILKDDKHVRIVQRRENTPGGQGTKLILNVRLREECCVEKQADKFVKLAAFESVDINDPKDNGQTAGEKKRFDMVQYLFKVKTATEGNDLYEKLSDYCKSK